MEILTGALITLVALLLYDKFKKPKKEKVDAEAQKREKEISDHFEALLNYTPEQAYRKVTK